MSPMCYHDGMRWGVLLISAVLVVAGCRTVHIPKNQIRNSEFGDWMLSCAIGRFGDPTCRIVRFDDTFTVLIRNQPGYLTVDYDFEIDGIRTLDAGRVVHIDEHQHLINTRFNWGFLTAGGATYPLFGLYGYRDQQISLSVQALDRMAAANEIEMMGKTKDKREHRRTIPTNGLQGARDAAYRWMGL